MSEQSKKGRASKRKGTRVEYEMVLLHKEMGLSIKRIPLSGSAKVLGDEYAGDLRLTLGDLELRGEVKARKSGNGFKTLESWIQESDLLFLKQNYKPPLVVLTWKTWQALIKHIKG